jgi:hypothetical protein
MLSMIQEFSTALISYTAASAKENNARNALNISKERRLKPIQERWSKKTIKEILDVTPNLQMN